MTALEELKKVVAYWNGYKANPSTAKIAISGDTLQEVITEIETLRARVEELEDIVRTRNMSCTWCGFMVVYDSQDESARQSALQQINTHALSCECDPRSKKALDKVNREA